MALLPCALFGTEGLSCKNITSAEDFQNLLNESSKLNGYILLDKDLNLEGQAFACNKLNIQGAGGHLSNFKKITVSGDLILFNVSVSNTSKGFYVSGDVNVQKCEFSNTGAFCINATSIESDVHVVFNDNYCHDCSSHSKSATTHVLQCFNSHGEVLRNRIENIGSKDDKACNVFRIGDKDGKEHHPSHDFEIAYNDIRNITSVDTPEMHIGGTNAISPAGNNINVHNNHIENINGIGYDREAIYSKISGGSIHDNYIKNGGTGQGSICIKGSHIDVYNNEIVCDSPLSTAIMAFGNGNKIKNNTISGYYKSGVRLYRFFEGSVYDNDITLYQDKILNEDYGDCGSGGISKKKNARAIIENNKVKIIKKTKTA